jgi:hypothetical protein
MKEKEDVRVAYQNLVNVTVAGIKSALELRDKEGLDEMLEVANLFMDHVTLRLHMYGILSENQMELLGLRLLDIERFVKEERKNVQKT